MEHAENCDSDILIIEEPYGSTQILTPVLEFHLPVRKASFEVVAYGAIPATCSPTSIFSVTVNCQVVVRYLSLVSVTLRPY